jgi:hypothetical protein
MCLYRKQTNQFLPYLFHKKERVFPLETKFDPFNFCEFLNEKIHVLLLGLEIIL